MAKLKLKAKCLKLNDWQWTFLQANGQEYMNTKSRVVQKKVRTENE
jgi:hypothetical protein